MSRATVETLFRLAGLYIVISTAIDMLANFGMLLTTSELFRSEGMFMGVAVPGIIRVVCGLFVVSKSGKFAEVACNLSPQTKRAMAEDAA